MIRTVVACVVALIAMNVAIAIGHSVNNRVHGIQPLGPETMNDRVKLEAFIGTMPTSALVGLCILYVVGVCVGVVVGQLVKQGHMAPTMTVVIAYLLATALIQHLIPHPPWLSYANFTVPVLAAALTHVAIVVSRVRVRPRVESAANFGS